MRFEPESHSYLRKFFELNGSKALFLFDIDGTLISPGKIARKLFIEITTELTGRKISLEFKHVAGFTDPLILKEMLQRAGVNGEEMDETLVNFFPIYYKRLKEIYINATEKKMFDEVKDIIYELSVKKNIYLGLVRGI